MYKQIYYT